MLKDIKVICSLSVGRCQKCGPKSKTDKAHILDFRSCERVSLILYFRDAVR